MKAEIRHMVVFKLLHSKGSEEEKKFLEDSASILGSIPYAAKFMVCEEVSPKNGFDYGFSFDFLTKEDYEKYNNDPRHIDYVNKRWLKEVAEFMEVDLKEVK